MGDPQASYKWQASVAGKGKKSKEKKPKPEKLENIVIKLGLKVKRRPFKGNFIKKVFGGAIEEGPGGPV